MESGQPIWDEVRRLYHYPSLPEPEYIEEEKGGACFDFKENEIRMGESFIKKLLEETDLDREEIEKGVQIHEVGHYMDFPHDLSTVILADKWLDDSFQDESEERKEFIFQTYADTINDTESVLERGRREPVLNLREEGQKILPDEFNKNVRKIVLSYLKWQAGEEYTLEKELEPYLDRLKSLHFPEDSTKLNISLEQFGEIILDMEEEYEGKASLEYTPKDMNIKDLLGDASSEDIHKATREIMDKVEKEEYEEIKEWLNEKNISSGKPDKEALTIGTGSGELSLDKETIEYYKELSKNYPLIISKKEIETEDTRKSFEGVEKWRVGENPFLAQPNLSGGYFLPGITRQVKVNEKSIKTKDYEVPNLLTVIDSSGSMPNPGSEKSFSVLAGYCAAQSYHLHGSHIGVINFSGDSFYLPYTRDLDEALGAISAYQGGGTTLNKEMLEEMLDEGRARMYKERSDRNMEDIPKKFVEKDVEVNVPEKAFSEEDIDLVMFTDGGLSNLEESLDFFEEKAEINRATIVLGDTYKEKKEYVDSKAEKINVYYVSEEEDIPGLVLGDIKRNLNSCKTYGE